MSRSLVVISAISMFSPARALRARDATPQLVTISSPNRLILEYPPEISGGWTLAASGSAFITAAKFA